MVRVLVQGGVGILLVASCHRNKDNVRPEGSLGLYADCTHFSLILSSSKGENQ